MGWVGELERRQEPKGAVARVFEYREVWGILTPSAIHQNSEFN